MSRDSHRDASPPAERTPKRPWSPPRLEVLDLDETRSGASPNNLFETETSKPSAS